MQISRINKLNLLSVVFRGYGTQRHNYYETLGVSPNCSQKEIRRSFIELSKKFHPDIIGETGHDKFVKLQEAYDILGKESTRREYDINLRYQSDTAYTSTNAKTRSDYEYRSNPYGTYRSRREWEEHMARGDWQPNNNGYEHVATFKKIFFFGIIMFSFVMLETLYMHDRAMTKRDLMQTKCQMEYNELRRSIKGLTLTQQIRVVQERIRLAEEEAEKKRNESRTET